MLNTAHFRRQYPTLKKNADISYGKVGNDQEMAQPERNYNVAIGKNDTLSWKLVQSYQEFVYTMYSENC